MQRNAGTDPGFVFIEIDPNHFSLAHPHQIVHERRIVVLLRPEKDGSFNVITRWNYGKICELVGGGKTATVSTKGALDDALSRARNAREVRVIEIKIPRNDASVQLARIGREVAKIRGWKKGSV